MDTPTQTETRPRRVHKSPLDDFTVDEWCSVIGVSRATAYKQFSTGEVRSYKIGGKRRVPASEREDYPRRQLAKAEGVDVA